MADRGQQTEPATPRRLEKARKEGKFPVSREMVSALQFLVFAGLVGAGGAAFYDRLARATRHLLKSAFTLELDAAVVARLLRALAVEVGAPMGVLGAALVAVALAAQLAGTRFGLAAKNLAPNFSRLNPVNRMRELPRQNVPLFLQGLVLLPLFALVVYGLVKDNLDALVRLPLESVEQGAKQLAGSIQGLTWKAAGLFMLLGAVDFWRQQRRYRADLRMSKQEIREEHKELEGNPQIKGRIRRLQREWLRRRMMQQVPTATMVITNPTHYAVAIRYAMESMAAPVVVAKGKNFLAQLIRKKATAHQVPIVENPPLAQALYQSTQVGQEIPAHLYRAVAEILAYIYRLMGGRPPA